MCSRSLRGQFVQDVRSRSTGGASRDLDHPRAAVYDDGLAVAQPPCRVASADDCRDAVLAGYEGGVGGEGAAVGDHSRSTPEERGPRRGGDAGDEHLPVLEPIEVFRAVHDPRPPGRATWARRLADEDGVRWHGPRAGGLDQAVHQCVYNHTPTTE